MTARAVRRAAERKAEKQARKAERLSTGTGPTGPRTPEGKAISCLNAPSAQGVWLPVVRGQEMPHGLTGNFKVMEFESQSAFDELRDALRAEHRPATPTEIVLVDRIAEHIWLSQRAQKFADAAFLDHSEKWMALMLRYRTTHDRAFHKCLAELRALRKERQQFESQKEEPHRPQTAESPRGKEQSETVQFESKSAEIQYSEQLAGVQDENVRFAERAKATRPAQFCKFG